MQQTLVSLTRSLGLTFTSFGLCVACGATPEAGKGSTSSTGGSGGSAGTAGAGGTTAGSAGSAGGESTTGGSEFTPADIPAVGTPGVDYLSDLPWTSAVVFEDFGAPGADHPIGKDETVNGKTPLVINGISYEKGLGVKTYTEITYDLGGQYSQFISDTGLDYQEDASTMIFELKLDGELVYDGGDSTSDKTELVPVSIDLTGKNTLMLYVRDGFDDKTHDFGVWGGARIVK
jgi:hypothetical protein